MVLNWSGSQVTPEEITGEIYTPGRKGSLQPVLISASRYHSRLPYVIRDFEALIQEVAAGHPVVVLQNLGLSWYPQWHYAVEIGYDLENRLVILRSGKVFRMEKGWSLFCRTWERADKWGLLVLPLNRLPASADEKSYLEAILTLEAVGRHEEASMAYKTALKLWPRSLGAIMGLGNSLYAMGKLHEAEAAFRTAIKLSPTCGDVYNNLAHVLAEQKRYDEALNAARKAVRLGGLNYSYILWNANRNYRIEGKGGEAMKTSVKLNGIWCNMGILAMAGILILSGCATRKYVGEQITPIADRVSRTENRIGQTEGQIAELGDKVTANETKISKVGVDLSKVDTKAELALANFGKLKFERHLLIDMRDGANFEFNSAILPDEAKQSIDVFMGNLKGELAGVQNAVFLIAGHTDNFGPEDINYELGKRRADAVSRYLVIQKKIDPLRVVTVSYGETSPIAGNDTQEGRAKNRRVEILVYREGITK